MNRRRRVLIVGPSPHRLGGIAGVLKLYFREWDYGRYDYRHIVSSVEGSRWKKAVVCTRGIVDFLQSALRERPDAVHIHFSSGVSFYRKSLFFILSKLLKLPTILHCHSGYFQAFYSEARWIENRYISMVLSRADCLFLVSDFWKAYFKTICPSTSSTIIYNPVAMPESVMLRDIEGYNVLTVGRLGKNKGTYDILRAVPDVVEAYPEVLFLFAGDGEIDNVRNILGQEQWQSNVKLLGWVEGERKRRAYEEADVFLLPSYHEALPLAILEAMAYGLAIITTPVGGIPDAIEDGVTGILVEPGNSSMIAAAISDLFDDRERARILGDSARLQAMREYEINNVLQMVYEAYDRLIDTRET